MKRKIFLLLGCIALMIVFFLYTTRMSKPEKLLLHTTDKKPDTLNLVMPKAEEKRSPKYEKFETKLTLLLLNNNLIYGYTGNKITTGNIYSYDEVRMLINKESAKHSPDKFVISIRPAEKATYKNTVDILDEMTINNIKEYELVGISDSERKFVQQFEQSAKN